MGMLCDNRPFALINTEELVKLTAIITTVVLMIKNTYNSKAETFRDPPALVYQIDFELVKGIFFALLYT